MEEENPLSSLFDDHGTNSSFGPDESVGASRSHVAFWYWGVWIIWRGIDVIRDVGRVSLLHL